MLPPCGIFKTPPHMMYSVIIRYSLNSPQFKALTHTQFSLYIPEWKGCEMGPGRIYKMHCSDINSCVLQGKKAVFESQSKLERSQTQT